MSLPNFPDSPTVGELFTQGQVTYEWTGTIWKRLTVKITPWVRPTDWPALPTVGTTEEKFAAIYGVDSTDSNYVALLCAVASGTYDVDWGDGTTDTNITSNTQAEHLYDYATISGTPTAVGGYKTVTVTVTPSSGSGAITAFSLQPKHTQAGLPTGTFAVNWLDMVINAPSMTSLAIGGQTVVLDKLEQAIIQEHNVTDFSSVFRDCRRLRNVPLFNTSTVNNMFFMFRDCFSLQTVPLFNTAAVTTMGSMFQNCTSLQTVPLFNTAAVTNMGTMFNGCVSLQTVPLFNTAAVTNMGTMFNGCVSLQTVPLFNTAAVTTMAGMFTGCSSLQTVPLFNTAAVTNMGNMFQNCTSLQTVPLFNTAAVTTMASMFFSCTSLQTVPLFNTAAVTTMASMLRNCTLLQTVPLFNTAAVTTMDSIFSGCTSLQQIPQLDTSGITSVSNSTRDMFLSCRSLARGRTNGIKYAVSYAGCKLSRAEIVEIFTGLGTADGAQIVNVSNNIGSSALDANDELIATNKGWTVTK
jgi:surface protein